MVSTAILVISIEDNMVNLNKNNSDLMLIVAAQQLSDFQLEGGCGIVLIPLIQPIR